MPQVFLITGASTGFGALAARSLALAGHTVFAGMYSHDGNTQPHEAAIRDFIAEHQNKTSTTTTTTAIPDLRPVSLDLLSPSSIASAVGHVLATSPTGTLDVVVHNAGHMCFGPAESFTPEQYLRLYDVNVVGAHRLNQAVLPHMRRRNHQQQQQQRQDEGEGAATTTVGGGEGEVEQQRHSHLIWISSSSVYGAKSPYLGPYFAAKAAMDSLAQSYAHEVAPWGVETTIVSPGVFTRGTSHFADAAGPGLRDVYEEYEESEESPTKGMGSMTMQGTVGMVEGVGDEWATDPQRVADALVELAGVPRGRKPWRVTVDPCQDGGEAGAAVVDVNRANAYRRFGLERFLKVAV